MDPTEPRDDCDAEDSDLLCELFEVLEKHGVDEGLRETVMDLIGRWEVEKRAAA